MAPRKRVAEEEEPAKANTAPVRVTRSSTRRAANANSVDPVLQSPKPKVPRKKKAKVEEKKSEVEEKKETVKSEDSAEEAEGGQEEEKALELAGDARKRTIVIEHCKQCNSFKTRAIQVKEGLEERVADINVLVNPDKPRRGCFEVRKQDGETFISLLDMKRPFKPMKDLNMKKEIDDIIKKING
ncbi:hypothetical protein FNV43_RR12817 [Rhamnella rubrinervis]|uniref:Selenoprotein H n=1 Tax=Rhamnella rubrinervis TaxID=2594499 RepID=A0A8K0H919_9ROSA|nr:hypothetical protein FNV43_RR12817 [Rhamnella rubrinervis]